MSRQKKDLIQRLDEFIEGWVSNPAAQLDFVNLIGEVRQKPHPELMAWVHGRREDLDFIGIRVGRDAE